MSIARDMNMSNAVTWPVNFWTSFLFLDDSMDAKTYILFELASIPLCVIMKLKKFLEATSNAHFDNLILSCTF